MRDIILLEIGLSSLLMLALIQACKPPCGAGTIPKDGSCEPADDSSGTDGGDTDSNAESDTGEPEDTGDLDEEVESISEEQQQEIADLIAEAEDQDWPELSEEVEHHLPYEEGVHMGISQGTACGSHAGSLEGSIDFTVSGNYESAHGIYAAASADGTVVATQTTVTGFVDGSYGNYVMLRHLDGTFSLYAHLAHGHVDVAVDDEVCAGQPLGLIGNTGESAGEHLHYEQRDESQVRVNPTLVELDPVPSTCNPCNTSSHETSCYESVNEFSECGDTGSTGDDCTIEASPAESAWTADFTPDTECTCSESDASCHALYQGRLDSMASNTVTMSFQKASGGSPSVDVSYWVVVGDDTEPSCVDIDSFFTRAEGTWESGDEVLSVSGIEIWPSESAFDDAAEGDTKKLFIITGGSDGPADRTWFQREAIVFTKRCE